MNIANNPCFEKCANQCISDVSKRLFKDEYANVLIGLALYIMLMFGSATVLTCVFDCFYRQCEKSDA